MLRRIKFGHIVPDKARHHTHFRDLIHALQSHPRLVVCLVSCLAAALAAAPAFAQQPYDGLWQVTVVTKTGSCDAQTHFNRDGRRRQDFGRPGFRQRRQRGTCASLDQWCICERSTQWQLRIGEMEWRISWRTVQRSMGSVPSIRQARLEILRPYAAADIRSRRVFLGARFAASPEPRPVGPVRRHGRQLVRRRHRHPGRRLERAHPLPRHLRGRRAQHGHELTCASDAYKFNLQADVVAEGGEVTGTWSETSRNVSGTLQGRGGGGTSRSSPAPPASTPTSRCGPPATSSRSPCGPTASSARANISLSK